MAPPHLPNPFAQGRGHQRGCTLSEEHRFAVKEMVKETITLRTARDGQRSVGPSELGTACDYCLGLALTRKHPEYSPLGDGSDGRSGFGLKAWIGTAVHEKLERDISRTVFDDRVRVENKVHIYDLDGYGPISGHVDVIYGDGDYTAVLDYKTSDVAKIRKYRTNGVPDSYVFQTNLYGYGLEQGGRVPDDVAISFIPRDSNTLNDVWTCFAPYRKDLAEQALLRLEEVWDRVRNYDVGTLEQSDECFNCRRRW